MIVLNTDVLINLIDKKLTLIQFIILNKCDEFQDEDIVTTSFNLEEFLYGLYKSKRKIDFSHPIFQLIILPFTSSESVRAAKLENTLEKLGK